MPGAIGKSIEFEASDAEPRLIAWLAGGLFVFVVLSPLILQFLFPGAVRPIVVTEGLARIPEPQLQLNPRQDLATFRRSEEVRLSSYGWIDRDRSVVHVPIDRALSLTLERGLPGWDR